MKKIFTLISMAFVAMSVNAQTESYKTVVDGAFAPEIANAVLEDGKLVATISTASTNLKAVAGANPKSVEGSGAQYINADGTVTEWDTPKFAGPKNHSDTGFSWVEGSGNPYVGIGAEEIVTEGEPTGTYRATYEYYSPDGTKGLPVTGFYIEFSATQAGMFKVQFWNNKGNSRELFLVDKETRVALTPQTQYKVEGFVNGQKNDDGTMKFFPQFPIGVDGYPYRIGNADQNIANAVLLGWFVFDAQPGKTYMIFGKDWQFGFAGYEFTPGATIDSYTPTDPTAIEAVKNVQTNADAPAYNLAGQKVDKNFKGVVVKNGKKMIQK